MDEDLDENLYNSSRNHPDVFSPKNGPEASEIKASEDSFSSELCELDICVSDASKDEDIKDVGGKEVNNNLDNKTVVVKESDSKPFAKNGGVDDPSSIKEINNASDNVAEIIKDPSVVNDSKAFDNASTESNKTADAIVNKTNKATGNAVVQNIEQSDEAIVPKAKAPVKSAQTTPFKMPNSQKIKVVPNMYGNYMKYYGYRNPEYSTDVR